MTRWTAVVPFKAPGFRKSRLVDMAEHDRDALAENMARHVLETLRQVPAIDSVVLLSPEPRAGVDWCEDLGRGLNAELEAFRAARASDAVLVVHADLPQLALADVLRLIDPCADGTVAVAPDRHERGTNAVAIPAGRPFVFRFGPDSLAKHREQGQVALVRTPGLANDIDTPADLAGHAAG